MGKNKNFGYDRFILVIHHEKHTWWNLIFSKTLSSLVWFQTQGSKRKKKNFLTATTSGECTCIIQFKSGRNSWIVEWRTNPALFNPKNKHPKIVNSALYW